MLEGLEISEVKFSYVRLNDIFRIDSNYFQKIFLQQEQRVLKTNSNRLIDLGCDLKSFGAYSLNNYVEYLEEGVPFVRGINLKNGRISFNNVIYISNEAHKLLWKSEVRPKTILLSMSGTIGDVAIASESLKYPINSNQDIAKITCNENLNPYYLYAFLTSYFGQNYLKREARGSVQQHVFLSQIEKFNIPEFSDIFYNTIENVVKSADLSDSKSQQCYLNAEQTLLEAVGLADFKPSTQNTNIKTFAQSFGASGRLDAEYYQPKYEEIESAIISFSGDFRLGDLIEYIDTGEYSEQYLSKEKDLKFYIRSTNIKNGLIDEHDDYFVNPDSFTKFAQKGDIVTARVGTLGVFGEVQDEIAGAVYSDNVLCFRLPNSFNSSVYTLWFNSKLNWELIDRFARGSVQQRLNQETLKGLLVPIIDPATQTKISELVQQSFSLKAKGEHLLSVAKRAVEIAIEQDEAAAMHFIENSQ